VVGMTEPVLTAYDAAQLTKSVVQSKASRAAKYVLREVRVNAELGKSIASIPLRDLPMWTIPWSIDFYLEDEEGMREFSFLVRSLKSLGYTVEYTKYFLEVSW
jgi:hypothetical protein